MRLLPRDRVDIGTGGLRGSSFTAHRVINDSRNEGWIRGRHDSNATLRGSVDPVDGSCISNCEIACSRLPVSLCLAKMTPMSDLEVSQ